MEGQPNQTPTEAAVDPSSVHRPARIMAFAATHTLIPCILGSLFVVAVLPLDALVLLIWLVVLNVASRRHFEAHRANFGIAVLGIQALVMVAIVAAAHLAPVKTTNHVLSRPVTLPKTEMTLAEIQEHVGSYRRESFPIFTLMTVPDAHRSATIRFPARQMTLRQFVTAVENQSSLRHHFRHCGNGSTVLWGGDCSLGLALREPEGLCQ